MTKVDTLDQLKKVARTKLNINMADESQEDENLDIKIFNKDGGEVEDEDLVLLKYVLHNFLQSIPHSMPDFKLKNICMVLL